MVLHIAKCPRCGMELDVSAFEVGQMVSCQCGAHLTVPLRESMATAAPGPPPAPPYTGGPASYGLMPQPAPQCKEATHAMIFGILGLAIGCLGIVFGPIAISKANQAEKMIQQNPHLQGAGMATAGKVMGIIATIFGVLTLFWALFVFGIMGTAVSGFD